MIPASGSQYLFFLTQSQVEPKQSSWPLQLRGRAILAALSAGSLLTTGLWAVRHWGWDLVLDWGMVGGAEFFWLGTAVASAAPLPEQTQDKPFHTAQLKPVVSLPSLPFEPQT